MRDCSSKKQLEVRDTTLPRDFKYLASFFPRARKQIDSKHKERKMEKGCEANKLQQEMRSTKKPVKELKSENEKEEAAREEAEAEIKALKAQLVNTQAELNRHRRESRRLDAVKRQRESELEEEQARRNRVVRDAATEKAKLERRVRELDPVLAFQSIFDQLFHIAQATLSECWGFGFKGTFEPNTCVKNGTASLLQKMHHAPFPLAIDKATGKFNSNLFEWGFHGTPVPENAQTIMCAGFDPKRRGQNGQVFGVGEYCGTADASGLQTALQYSKSHGALLVVLVCKLGRQHNYNTPSNMLVVNDLGGPALLLPIAVCYMVRPRGLCPCTDVTKSLSRSPSTVEFLDDDKKWCAWDDVEALPIQRAIIKGNRDVLRVSTARFWYDVDLKYMTQTNVSTGKMRSIRILSLKEEIAQTIFFQST